MTDDNIDQSYIYRDINGIVVGAKVYAYYENNDSYFAKIFLPGLEIYINSFKVSISPKYPEQGLWVQPPKQQRTFRPYLESSNLNPHWLHIQDLIKDAVKQYKSTLGVGEVLPPSEGNPFDGLSI